MIQKNLNLLRPKGDRHVRRLAWFAGFAAAAICVSPASGAIIRGTAASATAYRWTPAKAQVRVTALYRTPDTAYAGAPDAVVVKAVCAGLGKPVYHRYSKFACAVTMGGWGEYRGDGFHADQKIALRVTGSSSFVLIAGPGKLCPLTVKRCP